jgi:hypothetical protein
MILYFGAMIRILLLLAFVQVVWGRDFPLIGLHESPRVMAMGGAFVAVADDPQAGLLNPAGMMSVSQIGNELTYTAGTGRTPDQEVFALANPGTESGASFATGFLLQGVTDNQHVKYYVPHTGTNWRPFSQTSVGLTMRFPYRTSGDSLKSKWETIGDLSVMQGIQQLRFGAQVERMFGGAREFVQRRLRAGVSMGRANEYVIAYEWRGTPWHHTYDFHYESSHIGGELTLRKYVALRSGYVWSREHRITMGTAIGLLDHGWRVEAGWELPTGNRAETRWSVGIGFRG